MTTTSTRTARANKYAGTCTICRHHVPAGAGLLGGSSSTGWTTEHRPGQCDPEPAPVVAPAPAPKADTGYYATDSGDYYVVVANKAGTSTYAKRLVLVAAVDGSQRPRWEYAPGVGRTLAGTHPLTVAEAARLGHLHGYCIICCRALTDPASVQAGIGPVCATRLAV